MATLMKCDRCGDTKIHEINGESFAKKVSIPYIKNGASLRYTNLDEISTKEYDLCKDCLIKLKIFLEQVPDKE